MLELSLLRFVFGGHRLRSLVSRMPHRHVSLLYLVSAGESHRWKNLGDYLQLYLSSGVSSDVVSSLAVVELVQFSETSTGDARRVLTVFDQEV